MLKDKLQLHLNNLAAEAFETFFLINNKRPTNILFTTILVCWGFFSLLATAIPSTLDFDLLSPPEKLFLTIIKRSNLFMTSEILGIIPETVLLCFIGFYVLMIILYAYISHFRKKAAPSPMYRLILWFVPVIQEIYFWVLFPCDLQAHTKVAIVDFLHALFCVLAFLTFFIPIAYILWIRYTDFELYFAGKIPLAANTGKFYPVYIVGVFFLSLNEELISSIHSETLELVLNCILGIVLVFYTYKEKCFNSATMSKIAGAIASCYTFFAFWIILKFHTKLEFDVGLILFLGTLFIPKAFIHLVIEKDIRISSSNYLQLNTLDFEHLVKSVVNDLHYEGNDSLKAGYRVMMFLNNHKRLCKSSLCPCKNKELFPSNLAGFKVSGFGKSSWQKAYKKPVCEVLDFMFRERATRMTDPSQRLHINFGNVQFLTSHTNKNMQAYVKLISMSSAGIGYKMQFMIKKLHKSLGRTLYEEANSVHSELQFSEVIGFYEDLEQSVGLSLAMLADYCEVFDQLKNHVVDLDFLIRASKIINEKKALISKLLDAVCMRNANNTELLKLIDQISVLHIIDRDQFRKFQKLIQNEYTLANRIRAKTELPDIFNDLAVVIFTSLSENSKGHIRKITPNIKDVLGYQVQECENMTLNELMPAPFAEKHDGFLKEFLERGSKKRFNQLWHLYALDRQGFLVPIELFLRLETINSELMMGGYIRAKNIRTCNIMLDQYGTIINYDTKLHKALGYSLKSDKYLYGASICSVMPFLYPFYLNFPADSISDLFKSWQEEEFIEKDSTASVVTMECGFLCVPRRETTVSFLKGKLKNLVESGGMTGKNHVIEGMYLKTLMTSYQELSPEDVDFFSIKFNLKKNKQRDDIIKVSILEIEEMKRINNPELVQECLSKCAEFIRKVHIHLKELKGYGADTAHTFTREETIHTDRSGEVIQPSPRSPNIANKARRLRALTKYLLGIEVAPKEEEAVKSIENSPRDGESPVNVLMRTPKESMVAIFNHINKAIHDRSVKSKHKFSVNRSFSSIDDNVLGSDREGSSRTDDFSSFKFDAQTSTEAKTRPKDSDHQVSLHMRSLHNQKGIDSGKFENRVKFQRHVIEDSESPPAKPKLKSGFTLKVTPTPDSDDIEDRTPINKLKTFPEFRDNKFLLPEAPEKQSVTFEKSFMKLGNIDSDQEEKEPKLKVIKSATIDDQDQDLIAKQVLSGSGNKAEWNSGRRHRNHTVHKVKSSENTSLISNNQRYLTKLLHDRTFSRFLKPIRLYGLFMSATILGLMLTIFLLYLPALFSIHEFIDHADFTNRFLGAYSVFASRLELNIMINENLITVPADKDSILHETKTLLRLGYDLYKETYLNSLLNEDVHAFSQEVELSEILFKVKGLDIDSPNQITTLNFTSATSRVLHLMQEVIGNPYSDFNRAHEITQYFRSNYIEHFNILNGIARTLHAEIESRGPQDHLRHTLEILMILILCITGFFALVMIPIFRYVEKVQETGLSKMTTITPKDLDRHMILFQKAKSFIEGNLNLSTAVKASTSKSGLTSGIKKQKQQEEVKAQQHRVFRSWKKEKARAVVLLGVILLGFSPLLIYFAVVCEKIIIHLKHFKPVIQEFDLAIDAHAFFDAYYFVSYYTINEWAEAPADQGVFIHENQEILEKIKASGQDLVNFLSFTLEENLHIGESFSEEYKEKAQLFISEDVCEFIKEGFVEGETVEICETMLKGVAKLGLSTMLSKIFSLMNNILTVMKDSNFAFAKAQSLVNDEQFVELDQMMIYGDQILEDYTRIVRGNLLHILTNQNTEVFIELSIGICLCLGLYIFAWRYFIRKIDDALHLVKETMAVLPFDMLSQNVYITKYLRDNSSLVTSS